MSGSIVNLEDLDSLSEGLSASTDQPDYPAGSAVNIVPRGFATSAGVGFHDVSSNLVDAGSVDTTYALQDSTPPILGETKHPFITMLVGPSELFREGLSRILSTAKFPILFSTAC